MTAPPVPRQELGRPLRIWAISEIAPDRGGAGGHVVLRRHFVDRSAGQVVWSDPAAPLSHRGPLGRAAGGALHRALHSRFSSLTTGLQPLWDAVPTTIDPAAEPRGELGGPADLIFTVAHGTAWMTALRAAEALDRPLVTVFHDWYPDVPTMPAALRPIWDRAFRELARRSTVTLCVSEGMLEELCPHGGGRVFPPIPADPPPLGSTWRRPAGDTIRLFYAGLCGGYYAESLGALMQAVAADRRFALDVCGIGREELPVVAPEHADRVRVHGDVPAARRRAIAAGADTAIVVLPFDPARTRHLRTHFPSKLIEYCGLGRPLLVWGPPYASSIGWAMNSGAATAVTDPDPAAALQAVAREIAGGGAARSAAAAAALAQTEYHPDAIHEQFLDLLHASAGVPRPANSERRPVTSPPTRPFSVAASAAAAWETGRP